MVLLTVTPACLRAHKSTVYLKTRYKDDDPLCIYSGFNLFGSWLEQSRHYLKYVFKMLNLKMKGLNLGTLFCILG